MIKRYYGPGIPYAEQAARELGYPASRESGSGALLVTVASDAEAGKLAERYLRIMRDRTRELLRPSPAS